MTRRRVLVLIAAGAGVVALAVVVVATGAFGGGSPAASSSDNGFPTSRTTVKRETLTSQTQVSATLGYGDTGTIVAPGGTAPSAVDQARQAATTAEQQLATARTTAAADAAAFEHAKAAVAADKQKLTVDCAGDAAGSAAASPTAAGAGGGGDASPCASDAQTLSADEQTETQAAGKAASDTQAVASAAAGSSSASAAVTAAIASETFYGQSSTFTGLPALGTVVGRGQTLYEIDGQQVSLLVGSVAAWRAFVPGMSAGRDVAELNANLRALGYAAPLGDAFTAATASAIDAFQSRLGEPQTGALLLGAVVFEPHRVRVTAVTPTVGATVQPGPVLSVTSTRRVVTIQLDAADQNQVKVGDDVSITLPDNSTTPGKVTYVGTVATTPSSSADNG
ncbi:MAG TPA: peptidoglycan-binding protein, partial [Gaiellaceae bacterium]|nr:peptidoglycan-binding protein [Gaiellaceae bacterium]